MGKFLQVTQKLQFRIRCIHHIYFFWRGGAELVKVFHNAQAVMQTSGDTVWLITDKAAS